MTEPSGYALEPLREGADFTLYRGRQHGHPSPILAVALAEEQPSSQSLRRIEHEFSLASELDPAWAAKPLAITRHEGRSILILTDPGGEPLDLVLERQDQPLDLARVFAGNRAFSSKEWVVPAPAPAVVYSYNVTPDPSGIGGWPPDWVVLAIQTGLTPGSPLLCRPMPSGPTGGLGGMLAQDATDIGVYLTTIPPLPGGDDVPQCPVGDGG